MNPELDPCATWAACSDCLDRHGWQIGSDDVAHVFGRHIMLSTLQPDHPATIWISFDVETGVAWELCGCAVWREASGVLLSWHVYKTSKHIEDLGLQLPEDDDELTGLA